MSAVVTSSLALAFLAGLAAIVLGRNLTRSILAAVFALTGVGVAFAGAGVGFAGHFALVVAALGLCLLQLIGWMLVDVDRDHLPTTDRPTGLARSLAFLLLAAGLALLAFGLQRAAPPSPGPASDGGSTALRILEQSTPASVSLGGLLLAATLLSALMLLRGQGEGQ